MITAKITLCSQVCMAPCREKSVRVDGVFNYRMGCDGKIHSKPWFGCQEKSVRVDNMFNYTMRRDVFEVFDLVLYTAFITTNYLTVWCAFTATKSM